MKKLISLIVLLSLSHGIIACQETDPSGVGEPSSTTAATTHNPPEPAEPTPHPELIETVNFSIMVNEWWETYYDDFEFEAVYDRNGIYGVLSVETIPIPEMREDYDLPEEATATQMLGALRDFLLEEQESFDDEMNIEFTTVNGVEALEAEILYASFHSSDHYFVYVLVDKVNFYFIALESSSEELSRMREMLHSFMLNPNAVTVGQNTYISASRQVAADADAKTIHLIISEAIVRMESMNIPIPDDDLQLFATEDGWIGTDFTQIIENLNDKLPNFYGEAFVCIDNNMPVFVEWYKDNQEEIVGTYSVFN
jgi:hypothetical protein